MYLGESILLNRFAVWYCFLPQSRIHLASLGHVTMTYALARSLVLVCGEAPVHKEAKMIKTILRLLLKVGCIL